MYMYKCMYLPPLKYCDIPITVIIIIPDTLAIPATFIIAAVNLRLYTLINVTSTIGKREREREGERGRRREREREGEREREREEEGGRGREREGERGRGRERGRERGRRREGEGEREREREKGVTEKVKCNNY